MIAIVSPIPPAGGLLVTVSRGSQRAATNNEKIDAIDVRNELFGSRVIVAGSIQCLAIKVARRR